jgi:hypothetical protein
MYGDFRTGTHDDVDGRSCEIRTVIETAGIALSPRTLETPPELDPVSVAEIDFGSVPGGDEDLSGHRELRLPVRECVD